MASGRRTLGAIQRDLPRLHLIADRSRIADERRALEALREATRFGVDAIHVRDPLVGGRYLLAFAERCRDAVGADTMLIVNDRIDVALAVGAAAVQLGRRSIPTTAARRVAPLMYFGRSVHSLAEVAESDGADWLMVGTIFASGSHPGEPGTGPSLLAEVAGSSVIPIIAIGGIGIGNASQVLGAGAYGIAVISAILDAESPGAAASALRAVIDRT